MRIEFTKNELRAARRLTIKIAGEIDHRIGQQLMEQDMYEDLRKQAFVTVMENGGVLIDIPEELVVEHYELSYGYVEQVVNIGKMIYGLLKQFKMITKTFENQTVSLVERFLNKKEAPQKTEE